MPEHVFTRSLKLSVPRGEAFAFFSDARNLERITPPELGFRILTPQPINIRQGTLIDYRLKIRGFPVKWQTEISVWDPPHAFVDRQTHGPYKQWIHRHKFIEIDKDTTLIEDEVKYRIGFAPFGEMANLLVRRELDHIFDHREERVKAILCGQDEISVGHSPR
ncbi:MAG TPA: SRPBCC family protein [Pyrinomonadaceae bacterium]|nr:SRPBCC family protein [Pyrinomonadaceae bacterium]